MPEPSTCAVRKCWLLPPQVVITARREAYSVLNICPTDHRGHKLKVLEEEQALGFNMVQWEKASQPFRHCLYSMDAVSNAMIQRREPNSNISLLLL